MPERITILIVDDHPIFRHGLHDILSREEDFHVVGEAPDGEKALEFIRSRKPNIAVIDVEMPKLSGLELAERVQREELPVSLLVLTMYEEESIFDRAMKLGVMGYIIKDSADDDIVQAIRMVTRGDYFISPALVSHAVKKRRSTTSTDIVLNLNQLTITERYVLRMISQSKSTKEIAEKLSISVRTVERHRYNISQKLNLSGSYGLLRFAIEHKEQLESME